MLFYFDFVPLSSSNLECVDLAPPGRVGPVLPLVRGVGCSFSSGRVGRESAFCKAPYLTWLLRVKGKWKEGGGGGLSNEQIFRKGQIPCTDAEFTSGALGTFKYFVKHVFRVQCLACMCSFYNN